MFARAMKYTANNSPAERGFASWPDLAETSVRSLSDRVREEMKLLRRLREASGRESPFFISDVLDLDRMLLDSLEGAHLGKLAVSFQNPDSLSKVVQDPSTALSFNSGNSVVLAKRLLRARLSRRRHLQNLRALELAREESRFVEPVRENVWLNFVEKTHLAFRLRRCQTTSVVTFDGITGNLKHKGLKASVIVVVYDVIKRWDVVPLDAATVYLIPPAVPAGIYSSSTSCWEHGCNGIRFSTLANLLRHQREKSGQAEKVACPDCGALFRRMSARNGHLLRQECKAKRQSLPPIARVEPDQILRSPSVITAYAGRSYNDHSPAGHGRTKREGRSQSPATWPRGPPPEAQPELVKATGEYSNHQEPLHELPTASQSSPSNYYSGYDSEGGRPEFHANTEDIRLSQPIAPDDASLTGKSFFRRSVDDVDEVHGSVASPGHHQGGSSDESSVSEIDSTETRCNSEVPMSLDIVSRWRREILVDRIVCWMVKWLDSKLGLLTLRSHNSGATQKPQEPSSPQQNDPNRARYPPRKGRRGREGDQDSDDASGDDAEGRNPNGNDQGKDDEVLEFACPFLKHNPKKYLKLRSCSSYGWKSTHRMKEHLYRRHLLPQFKCIRCCRVFQTSDTLTEHSKAKSACEVVQEEPDQDGINQDQLTKLKSRKRSRDKASEHDKWIAAYKVLFPDDYLIPSPYIEGTDTGQNRESFLTALREHVGRESSRLIRPRLEEFMDEVLKESLTPQVLENLLRDVFTQVLNTFPRKKRASLRSPAPEPVSTDTCTPVSTEPTSLQGNATVPAIPAFQDAGIVHHWPAGDWATENDKPWPSQADYPHWQEPQQTVEVEAGPFSSLLAQDSGQVSGSTDDIALDPHDMMSIFGFDDFHAEYSAWLRHPEDTSSHADSGYFSLQSGGGTGSDTSKGKEVAKDPFAEF
ncbi:hypothetical protein VM1G_08874 [Cytospora mali]|uniref:C2H2-type domain-containing protein n=1 Tax=Cytospora mali TaxID=578113 RepID=A0A194WAH2_CYTMA|nr:hypothetical protein VM1G_08874 [Valsa mali]